MEDPSAEGEQAGEQGDGRHTEEGNQRAPTAEWSAVHVGRITPPFKKGRDSPRRAKKLRSVPDNTMMMGTTIELDEDLHERIQPHLEDDQTVEEFIEELLNMYETEGAFIQEGYSE